jgi:hypothetical protein
MKRLRTLLNRTAAIACNAAGQGLQEALNNSKARIASAAKQSSFSWKSSTDRSPRRCAPRDDGRMQSFLKACGSGGASQQRP